MKCIFCGGEQFAAHQVCRHDVIVDGDNYFMQDSGVYDSDTPYGPYTCQGCGAEYEELDPNKVNSRPSESALKEITQRLDSRYASITKGVPIRVAEDVPSGILDEIQSKVKPDTCRSDVWWTKAQIEDYVLNDKYHRSIDHRMVDLHKRLLSFGGNETCLPVYEEDLDRILERGQLWLGSKAMLKKGEPCRCHSNTANLYETNCADHEVTIATGYALSEDGIWRQHSWLMWRKPRSVKVVETTTPRLLYFGFIFTPAEAEEFCRNNY